jgi:hypothetical protein
MNECKCIVKKTNKKCTNPIKTDRGYCGIHKNCKNKYLEQAVNQIVHKEKKIGPVNSQCKCTVTKTKNKCTHPIKTDRGYCNIHKNCKHEFTKPSLVHMTHLIVKTSPPRHMTPLIVKTSPPKHMTPLIVKTNSPKHMTPLIVKTSPPRHRTASDEASGIPPILFTGPDAPDMSDNEISYLVNNYNLLRTGCDEECTLRGRPVVILTGKFHDKKLRNVNPFRFLNKDIINKYNLDIQLLIEVCDNLILYTPEKLFESIELLLTSYYKKNKIINLLYASCLSGIFLWNIIDYSFYPLKKEWGSGDNFGIEEIKPRDILKNYCWLFFDMIMNINKILYLSIYNKQNPVDAVYKVGEILEYAESATDGYMMNYYSETKLKNNCVLSSLMEACTLQAFGVNTFDIAIRLEAPIYVDKEGKEIHHIQHRALIPAGKNKKGAEFASHFAIEYQNIKIRSMVDNGYCTEHMLNFTVNKIDIAMSILYIDISIFKSMLIDNQNIFKYYKGALLKLFNQVGVLYYNLRIILECKLGKMIKKEVIDNEYFLDTKRDEEKFKYY